MSETEFNELTKDLLHLHIMKRKLEEREKEVMWRLSIMSNQRKQ